MCSSEGNGCAEVELVGKCKEHMEVKGGCMLDKEEQTWL